MKTSLLILVLCGLFAEVGAAADLATELTEAAQPDRGPVTVELASGRCFTAEVDPRTDPTQLWLRWRHGTIVVLRPICWEQVVRAEFGGELFSSEDLRQAVVRPGEPAGKGSDAGQGRAGYIRVHAQPSIDAHAVESTGSVRKSTTGPADAGRQEPLAVRSVAIDAWAANWDGDVEVDGLVVEVRPLDAHGAVAPVHGMLEVNLMGQRAGVTGSKQPAVRLGRWTQRVRPNEIGSLGAEYRLPFQTVHPEFDLRWASYGAVHARLSVPGEGVFETTQSTVRIRPYSAIRDDLQQSTGQRFFALERTGRGRR